MKSGMSDHVWKKDSFQSLWNEVKIPDREEHWISERIRAYVGYEEIFTRPIRKIKYDRTINKESNDISSSSKKKTRALVSAIKHDK